MAYPAIEVRGLAKEYTIGGRQQKGDTFREMIVGALTGPFDRLRGKRRVPDQEVFWALNDVSFKIRPGEAVGIIGPNGAGKSTLLKVLSRITHPTRGEVRIRGRVASLLEVGTGFHAELTGRENIFLNGAILGMSRKEIQGKFDAIVDFAGVDRFLDTPVKRYSSGMYVRLAFSVAAFLEPDILLVDEVLAVGDEAFQRRCLGKIGEIAGKEGRTVMFVSHNMGAITSLCGEALLMEGGQITLTGEAKSVVAGYLSRVSARQPQAALEVPKKGADVFFSRVALVDAALRHSSNIEAHADFIVQLEYEVRQQTSGLEVSFSVFNGHGHKIFFSGLAASRAVRGVDHAPGRYSTSTRIPGGFLAPGDYSITVGLHQPNVHLFDRRDHVLSFSINEAGSSSYQYAGQDIGSVLVNLQWTVESK